MSQAASIRVGPRGSIGGVRAGPRDSVDAALAFAGDRSVSVEQLLRAPVRWPEPSRLAEPLGLSGKLADATRTLGLETVGDLLAHLPRDHRQGCTIAALRADEPATVAVRVSSIVSRSVRRRKMRPLVEATVFDGSGSMRAVFFNQPWLVDRYVAGTALLLHGKADRRGCFRVIHHALGSGLPVDSVSRSHSVVGAREQGIEHRIVAHYAATEGISSTQIVTLVRERRDAFGHVVEPLPATLRAAERLPDRAAALRAIHFPQHPEDVVVGRERLAFEELLLVQLMFMVRRASARQRRGAPALIEPHSLTARWLERELPFQLTAEQQRATQTIARDLEQERPMQRLLLGEVGSGKTVVALYAMLRAVEHEHQAVLMAPTETLAEQHFATVQNLMGSESVRCELLTGSTPARRRNQTLGRLRNGECSLLIGTHALLEQDVHFARLAVAVVDEQHRFGVHQRSALEDKDKGRSPHTLHMTATPIPRTLQLTRYGDLEVIALRELPSGRGSIETRIVSGEAARALAYERLRQELKQGRQAYVVCPQVDEMAEELRAAKTEFERLQAGELAGFRLALLHGQMAAREKRAAMEAFVSGAAQVLVATTVIEVGVDVANATVILIEDAERFGISQLHQLRGRVGRGSHPSICFLVGSVGSIRLRALAQHSDGFRLAEIDLSIRKEGELVGTRQSGFGQFKVANLPEDEHLLERARARAEAIVAADPELRSPEHALLAQELRLQFGEQILRPIAA